MRGHATPETPQSGCGRGTAPKCGRTSNTDKGHRTTRSSARCAPAVYDNLPWALTGFERRFAVPLPWERAKRCRKRRRSWRRLQPLFCRWDSSVFPYRASSPKLTGQSSAAPRFGTNSASGGSLRQAPGPLLHRGCLKVGAVTGPTSRDSTGVTAGSG